MAIGRRLEVGRSGRSIEARKRCLFYAEFERQWSDSAHEWSDGSGKACCGDSGMARYRATAGFCEVARVFAGVATCGRSLGAVRMFGRLFAVGMAVRLVRMRGPNRVVVPLLGAEGHSCAVNSPRHVRRGEGEHGQENNERAKLFQHGPGQNTSDARIGKDEFGVRQNSGVCVVTFRLFVTPMLYWGNDSGSASCCTLGDIWPGCIVLGI